MKILAIGNSFSQDATRYLHQIARADGVDVQVTNLYIGGCPLEKHFRNMHSEERAYEIQHNGQRTGFFTSIKEALLSRSWDVITFQQVSQQSPHEESYHPYLEELAAYVRKYAPKAKFYIHQTWAYEAESPRLLNVAKYETPELMTADIVKAYAAAAETIDAKGIIRSGEVMQAMLQNGIPKVHRDTFHATLGLGRYALGLLWYHTLCNKSVLENTYCDLDEPVEPEQLELVRRIVEDF